MNINHQMINSPEINYPYFSQNQNANSTSINANSTNGIVCNYYKPFTPIAYSASDQLRIRIQENHLSYLSRDDTPLKLELRAKIESLITDYLSLIPHIHKFTFKEFSDCLSLSVKRPEFNPQKAICAFEAIEKYATNLLNYPWRREYRTIFAFSGFFYRVVDCGIVGYKNILELLGFSYDNSMHILKMVDVPIDPDKISQVSLECLVAIVEFKIMLDIHNLIKPTCPNVSWNDIYSVRSDYVCNTVNAVKLICDLQKSDKLIEFDADYSVKKFNKLDLLSPVSINASSSSALQNHIIPPPSNYLESNLDSMDSIDFIDGVKNEKLDEKMSQTDLIVSTTVSLSSSDPTRSIDSLFSNHCKTNNVKNSNTSKLNKCSDTLNNFSKLSNVLGSNSNVVSMPKSLDSSPRENYSNFINNDSSKKVSNLNQIDQALISEINQFENKPNKSSSCVVNLPEQKLKVSINDLRMNQSHLTTQNSISKMTNNGLDKRASPAKACVVKIKNQKSLDSWACKTCTYMNLTGKDICEMCHRSRVHGNELTPLVSGGRECSLCTLVNGKEDKFCKVCGTSLADSPTYI